MTIPEIEIEKEKDSDMDYFAPHRDSSIDHEGITPIPGDDSIVKGTQYTHNSSDASIIQGTHCPLHPPVTLREELARSFDRPRANTMGTYNTVTTARSMPTLRRRQTRLAQKEAHPLQHLGITLGLPMIIFFDVVVPIIIYYSWYNSTGADHTRQCEAQYPGVIPCPIPREQFNKDILGGAVASFGIGELWILVARVWRLLFRYEDCAPLLSRAKWELDATAWVYAVAMLIALVPFVVGSSLVIPELYLYGPSILMGFLGLLMAISILTPFKLPIGINSHARGSKMRPFIYYAAEDFLAVDNLQDREFRIRYNERYESSKMFRDFFFYLTLWWMLGVAVYIGAMSAIIWTRVPFHIAFGLMLGVLFSYIVVWAGTTYFWVKWEMSRENRAFEQAFDEETARNAAALPETRQVRP